MTDKILYRVLCDEYGEVARIFFEIKETGEQIEGSHQIQKWINNVFNENEQLKQTVSDWSSSYDELFEDVKRLEKENEQLKSENDSYKNIFFEIVETALTDTNCKKLYCKGILDIFDKANSLNQAREMIKEHLE